MEDKGEEKKDEKIEKDRRTRIEEFRGRVSPLSITKNPKREGVVVKKNTYEVPATSCGNERGGSRWKKKKDSSLFKPRYTPCNTPRHAPNPDSSDVNNSLKT